jgi:TIR domain
MPEPFYFISYSPVDGEDIALRLGDQLAAGPPSIPIWLAARNLQAGIDRDEQIVHALGGCGGLLYVMTTDGVHPDCECRQEWTRALKYKKPIIPLLFDRNVEQPFRLEPREPIDFRLSFDAGLARLREHMRWRGTPEGVLHTLKERLKDARRDFARAAAAERPRIQDEIPELERQIGERREAIENPQAAQQRTEKSIQAGLERERQPAEPVAGEVHTRFINRLPMIPRSGSRTGMWRRG